jgi:hypothetical protein
MMSQSKIEFFRCTSLKSDHSLTSRLFWILVTVHNKNGRKGILHESHFFSLEGFEGNAYIKVWNIGF